MNRLQSPFISELVINKRIGIDRFPPHKFVYTPDRLRRLSEFVAKQFTWIEFWYTVGKGLLS